jgi:hypothetical protein
VEFFNYLFWIIVGVVLLANILYAYNEARHMPRNRDKFNPTRRPPDRR